MKSALAPLYRLLEFADGYAVNQWLGRPTTDRFRALLARHVPNDPDGSVLDLGCGIGNYRDCVAGRYHGIDINPAYIEKARSRLTGDFRVMDCTRLAFADGAFDAAMTIATTHHLDDAQLRGMVGEALRVCRPGGRFHVIDAVLPVSPNLLFKRLWFGLDRGRWPRRVQDLLAIIGEAGAVEQHEILTGPLHDTIYVRVGRASGSGGFSATATT